MTKRHPGARKVRNDKKGEPDDLFIAKLFEAGKWAQSNQQLLTIGLVVAAIGVLGVMYWFNYQNTLQEQAATQIEAVHQSIALQDREGAKTELITFLDRFGGTPYEGEARLLLGDLYLQTDDPQQAMVVLEPLGASPRDPIEFQGATLLGAAYEQERRWDEAAEIYLRIADRSELDFQVRDALVAAARIRGVQGDADGAIELYERMLGTLEENSAERGQYEMRIAELRAATT